MEKNKGVSQSHLRYERKFFVTNLSKHELESAVTLHPAVFSEIYYERAVNNIYLDSFDMTNYFDNVIGLERRTKVRIRWYGDLLGDIQSPVLELKIKNGLVCSKVSFSLAGFRLNKDFSKDTVQDVFKRSQIPDALKLDLACLDISLLNNYRRKYYLSGDKRYRATLDSGLEFYGISALRNNFLNRSVDHTSNILEVKYGEDAEQDANKVTSHFSFRMTKSSKYIMGIERLNLMKTYSHV